MAENKPSGFTVNRENSSDNDEWELVADSDSTVSSENSTVRDVSEHVADLESVEDGVENKEKSSDPTNLPPISPKSAPVDVEVSSDPEKSNAEPTRNSESTLDDVEKELENLQVSPLATHFEYLAIRYYAGQPRITILSSRIDAKMASQVFYSKEGSGFKAELFGENGKYKCWGMENYDFLTAAVDFFLCPIQKTYTTFDRIYVHVEPGDAISDRILDMIETELGYIDRQVDVEMKKPNRDSSGPRSDQQDYNRGRDSQSITDSYHSNHARQDDQSKSPRDERNDQSSRYLYTYDGFRDYDRSYQSNHQEGGRYSPSARGSQSPLDDRSNQRRAIADQCNMPYYEDEWNRLSEKEHCNRRYRMLKQAQRFGYDRDDRDYHGHQYDAPRQDDRSHYRDHLDRHDQSNQGRYQQIRWSDRDNGRYDEPSARGYQNYRRSCDHHHPDCDNHPNRYQYRADDHHGRQDRSNQAQGRYQQDRRDYGRSEEHHRPTDRHGHDNQPSSSRYQSQRPNSSWRADCHMGLSLKDFLELKKHYNKFHRGSGNRCPYHGDSEGSSNSRNNNHAYQNQERPRYQDRSNAGIEESRYGRDQRRY